jgi:dipeptidyl aminopeptidase/acylaminoacyl peptidase
VIPEVDAPELMARMGSGVISAVVPSPAGDATAFVWSPRQFPMWYRLGVLRPDGEIVLTAPELRIWGRPRWAPSGHLAVGGFAGIRRVVFDIDVRTAAAHLITSTEASYELVEYVAAGHAQCRRRAMDGSVLLVDSRPGGDDLIETEHTSVAAWRSARLVSWDVGDLRLEGMLVPPADGDPPWETVTFLHGGPVATLAVGEHDRAGAWADPRWATFIPEFPASGICGESAMLAAFEARELPEVDHEVDAILAGIDSLVAAGLTDARQLYLVGHSYGAYLVNRALTRTNRFRAAVCWEGVADVRSLDAESLAHQATWRGGTPLEMPERWSAASPIDRAARVSTPLLLFYGASSRLVTQGERWHDTLRDAGVTAELVIKAGVGHTLETDESARAFQELVAAWFGGRRADPRA